MPSAVVRLLCESRSQSRTVRDAATGERPFYWRGSSVKFQLALADQGAFLSAADVGEIIVEVKALGASALDDSLMRQVFVAGDCDASFVAADWAGGTKQLLEAHFTVNEAAILPGSYRLIVRHVDGDGEENIYLSSELAVLDPQSGSEGIDPPPPAWSYLDTAPVIRYDSAQSLDSLERAQVLANLGIALSSGGGGVSDAGAVPLYTAGGGLIVSGQLDVRNDPSSTQLTLASYGLSEQYLGASGPLGSIFLMFPPISGTRTIYLPDANGTLLLNDGSNLDAQPFIEALGPPPGPFANDDLALAFGVEVGMPYRGTDGQVHWVQDAETYPTINKLALLGDSITEPTSAVGSGVTSFQASGWGSALRFSSGRRIEIGQRASTGEYDYGIAGAQAAQFEAGGLYRSVFEEVRDSDADTVALMIGSNDLAGSATAEVTAPIIVGLWDELIAAGKNVVAIAPPPRRESAPDSAQFLARRLALIELLEDAAASRGVQVIDPAPALDLDGDGHADPSMTADIVHPNMTGAIRLGRYIAACLSGRAQGSFKVTIPGEGNAAWVTEGSHMPGTPGVGNTATGLTVGSFVTARELIERTDGVEGNWQELTTSGMADGNILIASPTDFSMQRVQSTGTAHNIGDVLCAVAEVEMGSTFWLGQLNLWVTSTRTQDYSHAAGLAYVSQKPPAQKGILVTPPWTADAADTAYAQLFLYGNGTARIGRFGIFKLSAVDEDSAAYADAVAAEGVTVSLAQRQALSAFFTAEKAGGRWGTKIKELHLPIWGNADANAIDLVTLGSGTWGGTVTHAAGYAQGNGTTGYFQPILTPTTAGMTTGSAYMGVLCTQAPSGTGFAAFGGIGGTTNSLQLFSDSTFLRGSASGTSGTTAWAAGNRALHVGILSVLRTSTTLIQIRRRTSAGASTMSSASTDVSGNSVNTGAIRFMDQAGTGIFSDARLGAMFLGTGMTAQDDLDFSANLKTVWEALTGLALP